MRRGEERVDRQCRHQHHAGAHESLQEDGDGEGESRYPPYTDLQHDERDEQRQAMRHPVIEEHTVPVHGTPPHEDAHRGEHVTPRHEVQQEYDYCEQDETADGLNPRQLE